MIRNKTRKRVLSRSQRFCITPLQKMHGLMFSRHREDYACILVLSRPQRISLHMWFVNYPIDVIYADATYRVVDLKKNFRPFTFHTSIQEAVYAIELPAGAIEQARTRIGDTVAFETGLEGAYG